MHTDCRTRMGKVFFDPGIESVRGILIGTDPYYLRRYPDGRVESVIATKHGTIYKRTCYPKGTFPRRG